MLKKWKKTAKYCGTITVVLIYVTIGLFNNETLKGEERKNKSSNIVVESAFTTTRYLGTVKTIVGYSKEFKFKKELQERIECESEKHPSEADDTQTRWKYDSKLNLKIFSAYYDKRLEPYHYVRVIGLLPRNSSFYCQIWYQGSETMTYTTQKAVIQEVWSAEWGPKEKTCEDEYPAIISCLAPSQNKSKKLIPTWISFVDKSCLGGGTFVKITPPSLIRPFKRKNFVICVKPLHFAGVNVKSLMEWIEINHRLGAEKIVIYTSNSTDSDFVLHNYYKKRLVVKKKFETPQSRACPSRTFEESIWFKRKMEIIAYNDCFYSNLYHTKFVIPLDVDEIIVPKTGNNWFEAFRSYFLNAKLLEDTKNSWPEDIENYASFSVRNAYFFSEYPKDAIIRSLMLPKRDQNVPKKLVKAFLRNRESSFRENIFDRTIRSYHFSPKSDSVKSFIHVPKTLSVFNHYTFHVLDDATRQVIFPENVFQLNHYRNFCDPVLIDDCKDFLSHVMFDDSLEKFRNLTHNTTR